MVGYLSIPHSLTFIEADDASVSQPHNAPLHIEAFIHKHRIKQVLIDGGAGLNICTLSTIKQLGYSNKAVNSINKITIKAYDDEERSSKGTVTLPLRVGPVTKNVVFQVLDLDLTYNILLGRPWIHEMSAVPSTYHRCIKFPHNGVEVTIKADPNPFIYCNNLQPQSEIAIPVNRQVVPSSAYVDPKSLKASTSKQAEIKEKFKFKDMGCGEYIFHVDQLPLSAKVFSRQEQPTKNLQCQGIGCEPPSVVATKFECKSPLGVQASLDINSPKNGSKKESIECIANPLEKSHSLTISSTHSISTLLLDLDQQESKKPLLIGDEKSSFEKKNLKVKNKEKSFNPNQNQKLLDSAKIKVKDKNPMKQKEKELISPYIKITGGKSSTILSQNAYLLILSLHHAILLSLLFTIISLHSSSTCSTHPSPFGDTSWTFNGASLKDFVIRDSQTSLGDMHMGLCSPHTSNSISVPLSKKTITQATYHSVKEQCNYNHKVKPRTFEVGDLVLRENPKNQQDIEKKGKFEPNWLGPYIITTVYGSGAYQLSTTGGEPLEDPINNMHLHRFYT
ncbi:hypothetical protein SUGI_0811870 [Cryptomeria japonica]|nr:hypothetical protein SUGI_0811870 [Cryptomeria japonica]